MSFLSSAESVSLAHSDKIADQIADSIVDACLREDPFSKVACEVMISNTYIILAGEITTKASIDYRTVAKNALKKMAPQETEKKIIVDIHKQSEDISQSMHQKHLCAGDQTIIYGYATDETDTFLPLPIYLAHNILEKLVELRLTKTLPYLLPDAKTIVTIEYDNHYTPKRLHSLILSTQHKKEIAHKTLQEQVFNLIKPLIPSHLIDEKTLILINPSKKFVQGGSLTDCGLTGRKLQVDTYGSFIPHGGGAFSGKDPSKLDRSGAYMARYIAKNIVAAHWAKRCQVQLIYAIGKEEPIAFEIDTFGTSNIEKKQLMQAVQEIFPLTLEGIIDTLQLREPLYFQTASKGHFGRKEPLFTWEKNRQNSRLD